ncbi:O-succinylhomoserine sulfhydrylase [Candidatus Promineifilum breve]|uniref:homocysteine desulfhydrase n=1 Tax=Candidatus Promineifilum breve TaxID=1806508 RepID=A0A160T6G5_9CHLR|nr:PLP-dependent transferase [Candidatus Promineifilum breve]CUS04848.2 O-succinylhomoserine sulfhydrylase [Candidatus Promineifilum breve]
MQPKQPTEQPHIETQLIRRRTAAGPHREQVTPLYMASGFTFPDAATARAVYAGEQPGYVYSRWEHPNGDELIDRLCALEGADAGIAMASGMAALFTALAGLLNSGDHVLAARSLFGATHLLLTTILPRWGISYTYADGEHIASWAEHFRPETRLCLVETPSNPGLGLVDLAALAELCRARGVTLVVDNTFATPILQRPIALGADLVVHSTTKFLDGQGRTIGGVALGDALLIKELTHFARQTGPSLSPFNAWLLSQALETLPLRMARHCQNALALAAWLETQPGIATVCYPFLPSHPQYELARRQMSAGGGLVAFELAGGLAAGRCFLDALGMSDIVANLGDARTTATHPASTTHSGLSEDERRATGITPGLIRVSVGLEHIDDIIADVAQALEVTADRG